MVIIKVLVRKRWGLIKNKGKKYFNAGNSASIQHKGNLAC